jgi:hypothetical protein
LLREVVELAVPDPRVPQARMDQDDGKSLAGALVPEAPALDGYVTFDHVSVLDEARPKL